MLKTGKRGVAKLRSEVVALASLGPQGWDLVVTCSRSANCRTGVWVCDFSWVRVVVTIKVLASLICETFPHATAFVETEYGSIFFIGFVRRGTAP